MTTAPLRPRVVLDCNVILQAAAFEDGPAAGCLRAMERGAVDLLLSKPVLREYREVLARPEVRAVSPALADDRVSAFLERLEFRAIMLRRVPHRFDYPRDPKDEPYVDLAIAGRAAFLVSRDRDLLSLMTSHAAAGKRFRQISHPLVVLDPKAFLAAIG